MTRALIVLAGLFAVSASTAAHHGFGTFELGKTVSFTGAKFTRIELVNPHSWLYFELADSTGKVQKYRCEMRSAHVLRRSGWTPDLFPANSDLTVVISGPRSEYSHQQLGAACSHQSSDPKHLALPN